MRLLTWSCSRKDVDHCVERLGPLDADLLALQECLRPPDDRPSILWRGTPGHEGVAVASTDAALRLEPLEIPADRLHTVLPVIVHAPEPFILINIWARPEPTHEAFALTALEACAAGASLPMVVMGDFNSTPIVESQRRSSRALLRRMQDEFGLVSAYHAHLGVLHGQEPHATFFANKQENRPYHLDYCFVPEHWAGGIRSVQAGTFSEWAESDHRPLVVDLEA